MNRRIGLSLSAVLVLLVLGSTPAAAQLDRGSITGAVMDSSGAVIPNAGVLLTNTETGSVSRTSANEAGLYTLSNIPIGNYELRITSAGFKAYVRSGITLTVAQSLRLDVTLDPGQLQESVTVTGETPLLNLDSAQISTTVQSRAIQDLPLTFYGGRAMEAFAYALTPAVEGDNWESHIAGSPAFSKEVLIDGIPATAHEQGHVGETSPPVEAVQEFNVQTSGLSAEYGHTSGAVFNFALKSGTNDPHGSAFYYGRNEALNANSWMSNWKLTQESDPVARRPFLRARDRQVLTGASLGGPIVIPKVYNGRNRTFLFGVFEKYSMEDYQLSGSYNSTVPIPEFLDGDFSKLLTGQIVGQDALGRDVTGGQIFDPATLRKVEGKWVANPFAGNIIPAARISSVSKEYIATYRKGYQPMIPGRITNNATATATNNPWSHQNQFTFRGDHAFSDRNKLSASFTWSERPRYIGEPADSLWDPASKPNGGPFSNYGHQNVNGRQVRISDSWTISPSMINTITGAFNRYWNGGDDSRYPGPPATVAFGSAVNGIGMTAIGHGSKSSYYVGNTYIFNDSLAWTRGRHTIKMGFQTWRQQINDALTAPDQLDYDFSHYTTGLPGAAFADQVGFGFASFLIGEVNEARKSVALNLYGRRNYYEAYVQDDFRVSDRLTLNLGLRWEQARPFYEKYGRWANFNPDLTNTAYNVKGALEFATPGSSFERNKDWKEFAPRIGAALRLTDKAVLRGGWGVFYVPIGINYWTGVPYASYGTAADSYRGSNRWPQSNAQPWFNWDGGYPDKITAPSKDPNYLSWWVTSIDPDSLFQGYTHQYNASLEYQIRPNLLASAAYMGNLGRRLHHGALKRNQPQRSAYEDPKVDPFAYVWDAGSAAAAGVPYPFDGFSQFAGAALSPFPQIASVTWGPLHTVGANLGASRYDSFQLQLTKRMSKGFASQVSYVLSKSRGNVETNFDESWDDTGGIQDAYNLGPEADTVLSYDRTHVLKGYFQYQLPFGRGRGVLKSAPGWLNAIVGGWDVTWIFRYHSGVPLGISANAWRPGWDGTVYADWNQSADLSRQFDNSRFNPGLENDPVNLFFDRSAFANPAGHKLGNGKRRYEQLRGFGHSNEDFGLLKYWRFKERVSLQFRAELLNVFNRHHFANPNTGLGNQTNFGYVTGLTDDPPRNVQVGLRLGW